MLRSETNINPDAQGPNMVGQKSTGGYTLYNGGPARPPSQHTLHIHCHTPLGHISE